MQHLTLKAATTAIDQDLGQFEAVASAWEVDREGDTIARNAFDKTIAAWRASGKNLPLLFAHSTEEVGHIDPHQMRPTDAGLVVAGEVDRSTERGQAVWRSIKRGTAGFSIGYLAASRPRKGGGRHLIEIDLMEISSTVTPMHPATRALSWKSADRDPDELPTDAELRLEYEALMGQPDPELVAQFRDDMRRLLTHESNGDGKSVRRKSSEPIQVVNFDC